MWREHIVGTIVILLSQRGRTLLTLLGIGIGVAAVVTLTAIGQGARAAVIAQVERSGTNLIVIQEAPPRPPGGRLAYRLTTARRSPSKPRPFGRHMWRRICSARSA